MIDNNARHALLLMEMLVDHGPMSKLQTCQKLGWPESRFNAALGYAREHLCVPMEVAIPMPTPPQWLYRVTEDWDEVEQGAAFAMGRVDNTLRRVYQDVGIILPKLKRGTKEWRRANFLSKHLGHITDTMAEINDDPR